MKTSRRRPRHRAVSTQDLTATGVAEQRQAHQLRVAVDGWTVLLELPCRGRVRSSVERVAGFTLVHFDLPEGALGEYHLSVQQPFVDIHRSWVGAIDCWRGSELVSIALNYTFETAGNYRLPVICNFDRAGVNRGVIGLLDHEPRTTVNQRPILDQPPMQWLQTKFTRVRARGGFRETVVLGRQRQPFDQAVTAYMALCRQRSAITPMPAPDWAREPAWCSWYSHLYVLKQRDVEAQIPHLVKLGIRSVILDASWFKKPDEALHRESGDYLPNRELLPDLRGLSRRLHDHGLKLMVWCAPLYVGIHARARAAMQRYCVHDGKERSWRLCPFCAPARDFAAQLVERIMRDYELDGLKLDFLDDSRAACTDRRHGHSDGDYGRAMMPFMAGMRDAVLRANPDAAIEYRISYSTLATQAMANLHRGNDAPYDADYIRRENLFLRLFCDPATAVWSDYAYWHADESPLNVSLMLGQMVFSGGVPTLSVDLPALRPALRRVVGRWLRFYGEHRHALARARLAVHSADACMSVTSLHDAATQGAYVLLSGAATPAVRLPAATKQVWLVNAGAARDVDLALSIGPRTRRIRLRGRDVQAFSLR
jgi:hypothetical protein